MKRHDLSPITDHRSRITDHRSPTTARRARRGVALLIVLGLLGLLLISAVGFAVLMRTERSAATNYRHTSSARHLLFAALNRAIEEIDRDIGDNPTPDWPKGQVVVGKGTLARTLDTPAGVLFSYFDTSEIDETPVAARILTKDIVTYIPARFQRRLTEIKKEEDRGKLDKPGYDPPEWVPIRHNGSIVGRYAFAAIDSSGLLDANLVNEVVDKEQVKRWLGGSMGEVHLDKDLVTVKDIFCVDCFVYARDGEPKCPLHPTPTEPNFKGYGRFETIAELAALNWGLVPEKLSNFEVFSTFGTNRVPDDILVNLHGLDTAAKITAHKTEIENAFIECGFALSGDPGKVPLCSINVIRDLLVPGLIDYTDANSVMYPMPELVAEGREFDRPCTEMLPLVNAFGLNMTDYKMELMSGEGFAGSAYQHTLEHEVFLHIVDWPMAHSKAEDGPFRVRVAVMIKNPLAGTSAARQDRATGKWIYDYGISPTKGEKSAIFTVEWPYYPDRPSGSGGGNIFRNLENAPVFTVTTDQPIESESAPYLFFDMFVAVEVYNKNNEMCYQFPGNKKKDQFKSGFPGNNYDPRTDDDNWAQLPVAADFQNDTDYHLWAECVDPRFAYSFRPSQWYANQPGCGLPLLSSIAGYTPPKQYTDRDSATWLQYALYTTPDLAAKVGLKKERLDGFRDKRFGNDVSECDDYTTQRRMFAANAPLQSPGELGYLLCGPWETIKLYDHWPDINRPNRYHTVLDHFEVRDPGAEPKGKVNLNSASEDVLSLLFLDMPLRTEMPPNSSPGNLAAVVKGNVPNYLPQVLGKKLYTELHKKVADTGLPIDKLSDLACIYTNLPAAPGAPSLATPNPVSVVIDRCNAAPTGIKAIGEFEREAVIRNVCNLLTTKQQLFTIILRADAFTTRFGSDKLSDGTVLSSANAIAQIFRDPVKTTEADGHEYHKVTVRMLKILE